MEQKLEKMCKPEELVVGNRYSISEYPNFRSVLVVKSRINDYIELTFIDGVAAGVFQNSKTDVVFYEMPYTPLEQELL